jgi:release factor glutamine methyltransferase
MYKPREDSELLGKYVLKFARGRVLDMGCGSGVLMKIALGNTSKVEGIDNDRESVQFCRDKGLNVKLGNLFEDVFSKFDVIIFNPPYLPTDKEMKNHKDLFGGKNGWEIIDKFFKEVDNHLNEKGDILILFSSLTNKKKVDTIIKKNKFKFEEMEVKPVGLMEKLYVYRCYR